MRRIALVITSPPTITTLQSPPPAVRPRGPQTVSTWRSKPWPHTREKEKRDGRHDRARDIPRTGRASLKDPFIVSAEVRTRRRTTRQSGTIPRTMMMSLVTPHCLPRPAGSSYVDPSCLPNSSSTDLLARCSSCSLLLCSPSRSPSGRCSSLSSLRSSTLFASSSPANDPSRTLSSLCLRRH